MKSEVNDELKKQSNILNQILSQTKGSKATSHEPAP